MQSKLAKSLESKIVKAISYVGSDVLIPSNVLCEAFGIKKHSTVVNRIEQEMQKLEEFGVHVRGHQIRESLYTKRGKTERNYLLTPEGFMQVGLSFRTKEAALYRMVVTRLLHKAQEVLMRNKILEETNSTNPEWLPYRLDGKVIRRSLTDVINDKVVVYRIEKEGKQGDGWMFKSYTNLIYKAIGVEKPKGVAYRDIASPAELKLLEDMEQHVADLIVKYAEEGYHYKDVYKKVKLELILCRKK